MESHKIPWFQTTNKITIAKLQGSIYCYPMTPPMTSGWSPQSSGHSWAQGRSENDAFPMPKTLVNIWLITGSYPFWFWSYLKFCDLCTEVPQAVVPRVPKSPILPCSKPGPGSIFGVSQRWQWIRHRKLHPCSKHARKKEGKGAIFHHCTFLYWPL
jgi:hypothetical protein